ncbi:MAG: tetratricopeptide repeat protein [Gemmatimonadetes bacterium]|nr:tetratricopeptide repeat protein [Gemmatimonadota bacterium]
MKSEMAALVRGLLTRPWLIGAAALGIGMLVAVLLWRRTASAGSEPAASFVGTATCAGCHQQEFAAWKGSQHDRAMQDADSANVLGDFSGVTFTESGLPTTFFRRGGKPFVRTTGPDGALHDYAVRYTFGVEPLQQYLVDLGAGHVQPLSTAWDSRPREEGGQRWFHLYPGEGIEHTDELHWTGRQQNWNFMCADCHSTGVRKAYDPGADAFRTAWSEIDVSCEACHGPGSKHVDWAGTPSLIRALLWRDDGLPARLNERRGVQWRVDTRTGQPARSEPRTTATEVAVCAQCHSRRAQIAEGYTAGSPLEDFYVPALLAPGLYHPDGQQLDEVYTHASFLQSRMFHAGVTCSDCHEPHSQRLRAPGNQLCGQCHTPARYDNPAHHRHRAATEGAQCVSCHMPEETYMAIDPRRDHSIRIPRPDRSVTLGTPNPCTDCHKEQSAEWAARRVMEWSGGRQPGGFQTFAEAFHADDANRPGAAEALRRIVTQPAQPPIARASALARLSGRADALAVDAARVALEDAGPSVRRAALLVLEALPGQQRPAVAAPYLRDPSRIVRLQAAWLLAPVSAALGGEDRQAFALAADEFIASQRFNADRPENRVTLGTFLVQLGRAPEAVAEYRAALRISPRAIAAYVNLADLYRAQGMEGEGERLLREGLAAAPNDASLRHALGLSLARSGRTADAVVELGRAASLAPERPVLAYAYAVALHSSGQATRAVSVLANALERHPTDRDLLFARATFARDAGAAAEALHFADLLVKAHPSDQEARALLASLQRPGL